MPHGHRSNEAHNKFRLKQIPLKRRITKSMKLTVLGAGCWGLTLAWLLTDNFENITVWGREQDLSEDLIKTNTVQNL